MEKSNGSKDAAPRIICDGEIEIIKITDENIEEAVELFMENFPKGENFCISTNLPANKLAVEEIGLLCRDTLRDGISFAAKHIETGRMAGVCLNKILEPNCDTGVGDFLLNLESPELVFIGECVDRLEKTIDFYEKYNINCNMEVVFLSTRPEFGRKGIAQSLTAYAIDFARDFGNGLLSDEDFPKHVQGKRPKAVTSVFSSKFTQNIGDKLGFETVMELKFSELMFNGYKLSDKLNPIHECTTFSLKKL